MESNNLLLLLIVIGKKCPDIDFFLLQYSINS